VNVDFEDVRTVMADSGVAIMGMAEAEGDERALRAAREALASPLLNDNDISGAKYVLLNVALGSSAISMDEMTEVTEHIQDAAGSTADVIWGYCVDETLGERIRVTVIATGFNLNSNGTPIGEPKPEKVVIALEGEAKPVTTPLMNPFATAAEKAPAPVASVDVLAPYIKAPEAPVTPAAPEQKTIDFGELARSSQPELKSVPQAPMTPVVSVPNPPADRTPAPPVTEELTAPVESKEEKVVHNLLDGPSEPVRNEQPAQPVAQTQTPVVQEHRSPAHSSRVDERLARMREMSLRLRSANGVSDMEREPAYRRKNVTLGDVPHSADSNVSRYTLNEETDENGERRVELRRNNPFLHDNVD
jgi:cell division protein FtsZ